MSGSERPTALDLFDRVVDLPAEDRERVLQEACGDDRALMDELRAMLAADEADSPLLDGVPGAVPGELGVGSDGPEPEQIGPYRVVRVLGEGGMGQVLEVEGTSETGAHFALKIVTSEADSPESRRRFEAERGALGRMDHPGIPQVRDAGAADDGRPYFVMDLVDGSPIDDFCDERTLSVEARLDLALSVCGVLEHAHQRGVVHRDLKPSNVLVSEGPDGPAPQIIDFGVAKAIEGKLTDETLETMFGLALGTLPYMSPEQARGRAGGIDHRADVYSLGALVQEIVLGVTPADPKRIGVARFLADLDRCARTPPPVERLLSLAPQRLDEIAGLRGLHAQELLAVASGGLRHVLEAATERDRDRRYPSMEELARGLRAVRDAERAGSAPRVPKG